MGNVLVEVRDLEKRFSVRSGTLGAKLELRALQGVSFHINRGETLAIVGESGCGKSTLGRCLVRLSEPSNGQILFDGVDITRLSRNEMKPFRRRMQFIFQDPFSSLNPRMSVGSTLEEPLIIHKLFNSESLRRARVIELLKMVGLPAEAASRYPHEFSGGQRQRVGIARALAVEPELVVCDEPVSALDVSIQAQVVNLLMELQERLRLTYLFISHDLRLVAHLSHQVVVMYLGKIVEKAETRALFSNPQHPYTRALLSAVPIAVPKEDRKDSHSRIVLQGEPPRATEPPTGCQFHPRCFMAEERCRTEVPELKVPKAHPDQMASCLLVE